MNPHDLNRQQVEQASTQISYVYIYIIIIRHHTVHMHFFSGLSLQPQTVHYPTALMPKLSPLRAATPPHHRHAVKQGIEEHALVVNMGSYLRLDDMPLPSMGQPSAHVQLEQATPAAAATVDCLLLPPHPAAHKMQSVKEWDDAGPVDAPLRLPEIVVHSASASFEIQQQQRKATDSALGYESRGAAGGLGNLPVLGTLSRIGRMAINNPTFQLESLNSMKSRATPGSTNRPMTKRLSTLHLYQMLTPALVGRAKVRRGGRGAWWGQQGSGVRRGGKGVLQEPGMYPGS